MTSTELENLVRTGALKPEAPSESEVEGLRASGNARLADAANPSLSLESRFDLAYNAATRCRSRRCAALATGPDNRYVVLRCLPHTLRPPTASWRLLAKRHGMRNQAEYEGAVELDERLVDDLVAAAVAVRDAL